MSDDKQFFFVESPDGRKFKMVIRGDLGRLGVSKIRRYLANYGVEDHCLLFFNGIPLENDMIGDDFGLVGNSTLQIRYEDDEMAEGGGPPATEQRGAVGAAQTRTAPHAQPQAQPKETVPSSKAAPLRPHDAWGHSQEDYSELSELRAQLARVEAEKAALERKVAALSSGSTSPSPAAKADPFEKAKENLRVLAEDLKLPLQFDHSGTCVLNGDSRGGVGLGEGLSLFISYDAQTQRVVLYTTLLTRLPLEKPELLHKLYEVLLEGALLGREVCGGGIGISRENEVVVLQTSFSALHCDATLLRDTVPVFVETVIRWRQLIDELLF